MAMGTKENLGMIFTVVILIALIFTGYKIISPFILAILTAVIIAIAVSPLYKKLNRKVKNKNIAALIIVFSIIVFILIPLLFFANAMLQETINFYNTASSLDLSSLSDSIKDITGINADFERYFKETLLGTSNIFIESSAKIRAYILSGLANLFVLFFTLFFFIRDGKVLANKLKDAIPLKEKTKERLGKDIERSIHGLVVGLLIIALLEAIASFIGFYLFNVPNPLIWSFLVLILAMIPLIGPAFVWVPASIYLLIVGQNFDAIGLFIFSAIILSYIDNILRHQVISKTARTPQVLVLLGVFGGITIFGIPGIIIGPLILTILMVIYRIYEEEYVSKS